MFMICVGGASDQKKMCVNIPMISLWRDSLGLHLYGQTVQVYCLYCINLYLCTIMENPNIQIYQSMIMGGGMKLVYCMYCVYCVHTCIMYYYEKS